jgi:hypothetical protein
MSKIPANGKSLLLHLEDNIQTLRDKEIIEYVQVVKESISLEDMPFDHFMFNVITMKKFSEDTIIELLDDFKSALRVFDIESFYNLDEMPRLKLLLNLKD